MNTNLIYMHYNSVNMKSYIGLTTKTMMERWTQHLYAAFQTNDDGSFKSNVKFHRAIRKYGVDVWLHVELYSGTGSNMSLQDLEVYYIEKHNTYHNGYNSTLGGDGIDGESSRKGKVANRKDTVKGYYTGMRGKGYQVRVTYIRTRLNFGSFKLEDEAKAKADYLMGLSDEELLKEYKQYTDSNKKIIKGYTFDKKSGKYPVKLRVDGKQKYFGAYLTEQEAIDRVNEVRLELNL